MQIIDINDRPRECLRVFLDPSWPGYVSVEFAKKSNPTQTRIEWMPLVDFAARNPALNDLFTHQSLTPAPDVAGVVTTTTKNSLTDRRASWIKNAYAGYYLWISRGPGEGTTRTILRNTSTVLYLDKTWEVKPTRDSQYAIVSRLPANLTPSGQVLPHTELRQRVKKARQTSHH